jgi:hypothetical protein
MDRTTIAKPIPAPSTALVIRPQGSAEEHAADIAAARLLAGGALNRGQSILQSTARRGLAAPPLTREVIHEPGVQLDATLRAELGERLGFDLTTVRIHADARAARAADLVDARAYTVGRDIVFGAHEYAPSTSEGRVLILHELAHIAQQSCLTFAAVHLQRKGKKDAAKGSLLQQALDAEDDDKVRELVGSKEWDTTILEAWQAAWLLTYLLSGYTGDDDEQAGLKILDNVDANNRLDLTLQALKQGDRWEQLFDDYNGPEYGLLLTQLSLGIQTLDVRAMFIDKFIDEWFVDLGEETAITRLLKLAPDAELPALLDQKKRESELRDAIDNTEPRRGFEQRVGRKNEVNFDEGKKRATAVIQEQVKISPTAKERTAADIQRILTDAPKDLAAEAKRYKDQLKTELDKPEPDWGKVKELHDEFTRALDAIEARKRAETELELKYNLRFNIWERPAGTTEPEKWGAPWTTEDLAELDKLLQKLPVGILASSTELHAFYRAKEQQWLAGQAKETDVTLYGPSGLNYGVLLHEIGHTVSFTDGKKMQNAFDKKFQWLALAAKDVPQKVQKELAGYSADQQREKGARVKHTVDAKDPKGALPVGTWYIRTNRYGSGYLAHPADMPFISDYAASDHYDDFAESFEWYVRDEGRELKKQCPDKYDFMHVEVFVGYFLEKQRERALKEFDELKNKLNATVSWPVLRTTQIHPQFVTPLGKDLDTALTGKVGTMHAAAESGLIKKHLPLEGNEAAKLAAPFLAKLQALFDVIAPIADADRAFQSAWDAHPFKSKATLPGVLDQLADLIKGRLVAELVPQFPPLATRVIAGQAVPVSEWKDVDAVVARYVAMIPRVDPLVPEYAKQHSIVDNPFLSDVAHEAASKKVDAILEKIFNPKPKSSSKKVKRAPAADEESDRPQRPENLVPAGGRPLRDDARAYMESQIGRDFGDVRVHDDATAAESADALQADAYTVGRDIMFARGKHSPDTAEGRELLGHELAHVAQQGEAAEQAPMGAGAQDRAERIPTVLEEPVTIPDTIPAEPVEDDAAAPARAIPGAERETVQAAPTIALKRAAGASSFDAAGVVPADHPSERQAAAIGRQVAGREPASIHALHAQAGGVHRAPAAGETAPVQRTDIVFFMGSKDSKSNPFYKNARAYFKAHVKTDLTVDNDKYRSLAGVFTYLRGLDSATKIGNIYLVSHANEDGTLSFGIDAADKDAHTSYGELKTAVKDRPELFALPVGMIDRQSVIHIKGCNIGRSTEMLNKLDEAFGGGRGLVTAPTHKQAYGTQTVGGKTTTFEALSHYFLEYSGPVTRTRAEQLAEFKSKYAHIPEARWATLLPKAGAKREVIAFKFSYSNAADVEEAMAKARAYGDENFTRPEIYVWRVVSSKKVKDGRVDVQLVAEKTNYTINKLIEDEEKKKLVPDEANPEFFGKSTYYQTPTNPGQLQLEPTRMTTPALMGRLAEIDAELATPQPLEDEGRKREAEYERGVLQDELGRRNIAVDVKVVKTEDWLGADEVYVKASRGGAATTTKTHKLNDGQEHVYFVPLMKLLPLSAPVRLEVYDEDWPDRDDLIVRMDWRPPFEPLQNSESMDEADYRVQVRFER